LGSYLISKSIKYLTLSNQYPEAMNRLKKIALIKGILNGTRSLAELRTPHFAIMHENPDTGQLSPCSPYGICREDDEKAQRNAKLYELSKGDPTITVIKILYG